MEFYLIVCVLVGLLGRKTRIGFIGVLVLSVILTPLITVIGLIALAPSKSRQAHTSET